jgi:hypothetical protein
MKERLELFSKAFGLVLVCAGLLFSARAVADLLQPVPDLPRFWRYVESLPGALEVGRSQAELWRSMMGDPKRSALLRLAVQGLCPLCLGLFLMRRSDIISRFCVGEGGSRSTSSRRPAAGEPEMRAEPAPHGASGPAEDPDARYAPPGYR